MKIAMVSTAQTPTPPPGYGSEMATWELADHLGRHNHDVTLFGCAGTMAPHNGRAIEIPGPFQEQSELGTAKISAAEATPFYRHRELLMECDVVHDMSLSGRTHELLFENEIWRSLLTLNGISYITPRTPKARWNIVVVSECSRRHARAGLGPYTDTPQERVAANDPGRLETCRVVRYGCDTEFYRPAHARRGGYVLYVGRPHPCKGIDILLAVAHANPRKHFVLAWRAELGDHKRSEEAYVAAAAQHAVRNVEFFELPAGAGHHAVKRDLMANCDVFFHPATYVDACPRGVIEAQACGAPVVAFERGGTPELVVDRKTAILVPYFRWWEDEKATVRAFTAALEVANSLDRDEIRRHAEDDLTVGRMANDYLRLYAVAASGIRW